MTSSGSWVLLASLGVPLLGALALLLVGGDAGERLSRPIGIVVSGVTLLLTVLDAAIFAAGAPGELRLETSWRWLPALDVRFHVGIDGISLPLLVLSALLTLLCCVYVSRVAPHGPGLRALVALLLLMEVGLLGTFASLDLILFFLFFELVLIPMWFVIASYGDAVHGSDGSDRPPSAAATTFILYTVLGSAVTLVGFLLVHAETGTFDIVELATRGGDGMSRTTQVLAAVAMSVGFAVKTPMWPLHTWLPDAHTAAPTVGSVLLAGSLLKMGTYGLIRIVVPIVPEGAEVIAPYLGALGTAGIVYGSLACLAPRDAKRLIAFSSVGHMGFILLGIATMTPVGLNGALYANIGHGLITGLLFFVVGGIKDRHGSADLARIGRGLYARAPHLGGVLAFGAVASLGLPGLAGFWGEALALFGAYNPGGSLSTPLFRTYMAIAGVGAVLTAAYLLRLVREVCQGPPAGARARGSEIDDITPIEGAAWGPLVALTLVAGVWPAALLGLSSPVVTGLLASLPGSSGVPG